MYERTAACEVGLIFRVIFHIVRVKNYKAFIKLRNRDLKVNFYFKSESSVKRS